MPQGYVGLIPGGSPLQADGTAVTGTAAASLLNAQAKATMGAGFVDVIGKSFLIKASGRISNIITTPGTLTVDLRLGSVVVATSGALTLSVTAKTNVSWYLEWLLTCRAIGVGGSATANFMHTGMLTSESLGATTVAGEAKSMLLPVSVPQVGTSFDPAAAEQWDMFATFSLTGNSMTCHQFIPLSLN